MQVSSAIVNPTTITVTLKATDGSTLNSAYDIQAWIAKNTGAAYGSSGTITGAYSDSISGPFGTQDAKVVFSGLTPGTTYYMNFREVNNTITEVTNVQRETPAGPLISVEPEFQTSIIISWPYMYNIDHFEVAYATGMDITTSDYTYGPFTTYSVVASPNDILQSIKITGLPTPPDTGAPYYIKVRAYSALSPLAGTYFESDMRATTLIPSSIQPTITFSGSGLNFAENNIDYTLGKDQTITVTTTSLPLNTRLAVLAGPPLAMSSEILSSPNTIIAATGVKTITTAAYSEAGLKGIHAVLVDPTSSMIVGIAKHALVYVNTSVLIANPLITQISPNIKISIPDAGVGAGSYTWQRRTASGTSWSAYTDASGGIFTPSVDSSGNRVLTIDNTGSASGWEGQYCIVATTSDSRFYTIVQHTDPATVIALAAPTDVSSNVGVGSITMSWAAPTKSATHSNSWPGIDSQYQLTATKTAAGVEAPVTNGSATVSTTSYTFSGLSSTENPHKVALRAFVPYTTPDAKAFISAAPVLTSGIDVIAAPTTLNNPVVLHNSTGELTTTANSGALFYIIQANTAANISSYTWEKSSYDGVNWSGWTSLSSSGLYFNTEVSNGKVTLYLDSSQAYAAEGRYRLTGTAAPGYANPPPSSYCTAIELAMVMSVNAIPGMQSLTAVWNPVMPSPTHTEDASGTAITYSLYTTYPSTIAGKRDISPVTAYFAGDVSGSSLTKVVTGLTAARNDYTVVVYTDIPSTDTLAFMYPLQIESNTVTVTDNPLTATSLGSITITETSSGNVAMSVPAATGIASRQWQRATYSNNAWSNWVDIVIATGPALSVGSFETVKFRVTGTASPGYATPTPTAEVYKLEQNAVTGLILTTGSTSISASWTAAVKTDAHTAVSPGSSPSYIVNLYISGSTTVSQTTTVTGTTASFTGLSPMTRYIIRVITTTADTATIVYHDSYPASASTTTAAAPAAICFLADAPVLTPAGYRPISTIRVGDMVRTAAGRDVAVKRVFVKQYEAGPAVNPFVIPRGLFGAVRALPISPNHEIMVPKKGMIKAKDLGLPRMKMVGAFTYYNLELEDWVRDNLVVAGVECESLAPASRVTMSKAEFSQFVMKRYGPAAASRLHKVCFEELDGSVSLPALTLPK